jgi:hypothetical protein
MFHIVEFSIHQDLDITFHNEIQMPIKTELINESFISNEIQMPIKTKLNNKGHKILLIFDTYRLFLKKRRDIKMNLDYF